MRQKYLSPEQNVRPGTEYARSIARYQPRHARRSDWMSYLDHPLAPALALGLLAAGVMLLWPRQAQGRRWEEHDGDAEYADFPPRRREQSARASATSYL